MDIATITAQNLASPVILFFMLGIVAGLCRSTLTIPETLSKSASLYLMMAIGFRGGVELSHGGVDRSIVSAIAAAVALSTVSSVAPPGDRPSSHAANIPAVAPTSGI